MNLGGVENETSTDILLGQLLCFMDNTDFDAKAYGKEQMMKLIDVEWLKQRINSAFWSEIGKIIDSAPTIDIVRCGECSKRKKNKFCLEHMRHEKDDDGFCSYGEKGAINE